jgi:citrate lyase subunit beta/citryl-CoA lyase
MSLRREGTTIADAQTFLFVPGVRDDRYDKAVGSGADIVIIDLEDAVAPSDKKVARERVASWLARGGRAAVRVNAVGTPWFRADVAVAQNAVALVLPKTESADDLNRVAERTEGRVPVIALIETARGVMAAAEICTAPSVERIAFGNVDLAADLGVDPMSRPALAAARSHLVHASRGARLSSPIDGVTTNIADVQELLGDTAHARELGFAAKLLIHPSQVAPVARAFRPTAAEVEWAHGVLGAVGNSVGVHQGHMVDEPVLHRARQILRREPRISSP